MREQRACIFTDCRKFGTCQRKDNCYLAKTDEQRKAEADEAFSKYPVGKTLVPETDAEKIERLTNFVMELQEENEVLRCNISTRDYFAAAALQGFLASYAHPHQPFILPSEDEIAEAAGRYADAMLRERSK